MEFLKKNRLTILFSLVVFFLYFATRLYNLSSLPIFTDEAIYTRWSQIARYDANWRFISLTDGKQPSFVWADMVIMRFVEDPLLAGRLVSVFSGFFGLIGIYFLASELFKNRRVGVVASLLYLVYPFALVYDRMALYDSMVATIAIWALYFEVVLVRRLRLDTALILGMVLGFGVLTKYNAFLSIYLMPFTLLLFDIKHKERVNRFLKWGGLAFLSTVMAYGFYTMLRLSPFFHIIAEKTSIFVFPISEWIRLPRPFEFMFGNLNGLTDWYISYATVPIFLLTFASFFIGGTKYLREKILLLIFFAAPFGGLALFGKVLYPRFILFMTMFLLVLAAYSLVYFLDRVKNKYVKALVFLGCISFMLRADFYILTDFPKAPIAKADTDQFANAWPAGGGGKEIVNFFKEESKDKKIYVATEGTFGSLPTYIMEIYLDENKNIEKRGIWPLTPMIPEDFLERAEKMRVFIVLNQSQLPPPAWPLKQIAKYQKGIGDSYMSVYEVIPNR